MPTKRTRPGAGVRAEPREIVPLSKPDTADHSIPFARPPDAGRASDRDFAYPAAFHELLTADEQRGLAIAQAMSTAELHDIHMFGRFVRPGDPESLVWAVVYELTRRRRRGRLLALATLRRYARQCPFSRAELAFRLEREGSDHPAERPGP